MSNVVWVRSNLALSWVGVKLIWLIHPGAHCSSVQLQPWAGLIWLVAHISQFCDISERNSTEEPENGALGISANRGALCPPWVASATTWGPAHPCRGEERASPQLKRQLLIFCLFPLTRHHSPCDLICDKPNCLRAQGSAGLCLFLLCFSITGSLCVRARGEMKIIDVLIIVEMQLQEKWLKSAREELVVPWVAVAPLVMGLNPAKAQYELTAKLGAANHSFLISAEPGTKETFWRSS